MCARNFSVYFYCFHLQTSEDLKNLFCFVFSGIFHLHGLNNNEEHADIIKFQRLILDQVCDMNDQNPSAFAQ